MSVSTIRWVSCTYAVALGYLLLAPQPLFFLGSTGAAIDYSVSATISDWIEHAVAYAILAGFFVAAFRNGRLTAPLLAAAGHGLLTESLQYWIPQREAGWKDLAANFCGILATGVAAMVVRRRPSWRTSLSSAIRNSGSQALSEPLRPVRER
jgi:VanZ family protein